MNYLTFLNEELYDFLMYVRGYSFLQLDQLIWPQNLYQVDMFNKNWTVEEKWWKIT